MVSQQKPSHLLPDPQCLHLHFLETDTTTITAVVSTTAEEGVCPQCRHRTDKVHSRYMRTLADLPWMGCAVRLQLHVRRFFCTNAACQRQIFTERVPSIVAPYARRTTRLSEVFEVMGLALGGEAGTRLLAALGLVTSPTTLIRFVHAASEAEPSTPRVLGVDDFAFRRGKTYGTILVDLEKRIPIELLPDREAKTLETWLAGHPGVEIVSRDRAGAYAEGATKGAPQAIQVADRFHLFLNLGDALEKLLAFHQELLQTIRIPPDTAAGDGTAPMPDTQASSERPTPSDAAPTDESLPDHPLSKGQTLKQQAGEQRLARRTARYEEIQRLHQQGWTMSAIAEQVGMHRDTVAKYLTSPTVPRYQARPSRASVLDPFKPHLLTRWNEGCHTGTELIKEIEMQGYTGGRTVAFRFIAQLRQAQGVPPKKRTNVATKTITDPTTRKLTPRRGAGLILSRSDQLKEHEQKQLQALRTAHTTIETAVTLAQEFATILRERQADRLEPWLEEAKRSQIPELVSFAAGIRRDYQAVKAAATLPWSNGPVEAQVQKLKCVKRQMFGRAKFPLLRKRVLRRA